MSHYLTDPTVHQVEHHFDYSELHLTGSPGDVLVTIHHADQAEEMARVWLAVAAHLRDVERAEADRLDRSAARALNAERLPAPIGRVVPIRIQGPCPCGRATCEDAGSTSGDVA